MRGASVGVHSRRWHKAGQEILEHPPSALVEGQTRSILLVSQLKAQLEARYLRELPRTAQGLDEVMVRPVAALPSSPATMPST